jgi:ADP-ribosyl-[dinitrogen reductase] hydrolase
MTLCLAQSLIENEGKFIPQDQVKRFIRWYNDGYLSSTGICFDIGATTRIALESWEEFFQQLPAGLSYLDPETYRLAQARVDNLLKRKVFHPCSSLRKI